MEASEGGVIRGSKTIVAFSRPEGNATSLKGLLGDAVFVTSGEPGFRSLRVIERFLQVQP